MDDGLHADLYDFFEAAKVRHTLLNAAMRVMLDETPEQVLSDPNVKKAITYVANLNRRALDPRDFRESSAAVLRWLHNL